MKVDLTSAFIRAKSQANLWTMMQFLQLSDCIQEAIEGATLDWDRGAGEDWGFIMLDDELIALLHAGWPLTICLEEYAQRVEPCIARPVLLVSVQDMVTKQYFIDPEHVDQLFPNRWSNVVDPTAFSISDLWWTTI